jgi:uncharacterized protein involved in cysteine biosynthesis
MGQGRHAAALAFVNIMKQLPDTNVNVLKRAHYFEFATAVVRASVQSLQRHGVVNTEAAIMTGCQYAGFPAQLANVMSSMSARLENAACTCFTEASLRLVSLAVPLTALTRLPYSIQGGKDFITSSDATARTAPPSMSAFRPIPR